MQYEVHFLDQGILFLTFSFLEEVVQATGHSGEMRSKSSGSQRRGAPAMF